MPKYAQVCPINSSLITKTRRGHYWLLYQSVHQHRHSRFKPICVILTRQILWLIPTTWINQISTTLQNWPTWHHGNPQFYTQLFLGWNIQTLFQELKFISNSVGFFRNRAEPPENSWKRDEMPSNLPILGHIDLPGTHGLSGVTIDSLVCPRHHFIATRESDQKLTPKLWHVTNFFGFRNFHIFWIVGFDVGINVQVLSKTCQICKTCILTSLVLIYTWSSVLEASHSTETSLETINRNC